MSNQNNKKIPAIELALINCTWDWKMDNRMEWIMGMNNFGNVNSSL